MRGSMKESLSSLPFHLRANERISLKFDAKNARFLRFAIELLVTFDKEEKKN